MSGNKAKEYENQQAAALKADTIARQTYLGQQNNLYGPIQQNLAEEEANPTPLNYGANLGQINQQTQAGEQRLNGMMAKTGMTGSGLQAAGQQGLEMGRVGELSSAFNTGLQARTKLGIGLLQNYNPLGNAQFGQGALGAQMKFGAGEQGLYNTGMEQGMTGFGKGLAGVLNGIHPNQNPGMPELDSLQLNNNAGLPGGQMGADIGGLNLSATQTAFPQGWDMTQTGTADMSGLSDLSSSTSDLSSLDAFGGF
jgi:hypothetical protein